MEPRPFVASIFPLQMDFPAIVQHHPPFSMVVFFFQLNYIVFIGFSTRFYKQLFSTRHNNFPLYLLYFVDFSMLLLWLLFLSWMLLLLLLLFLVYIKWWLIFNCNFLHILHVVLLFICIYFLYLFLWKFKHLTPFVYFATLFLMFILFLSFYLVFLHFYRLFWC